MPALATYEQAVSPENVAKVSLTGLSFILQIHAHVSAEAVHDAAHRDGVASVTKEQLRHRPVMVHQLQAQPSSPTPA